MRVIRLTGALLALCLAACSTTQSGLEGGSSMMIDVPTPPFPYNSRFCT